MDKTKARIIAFYLPQFHPIKENNLWWGNGFTEWTNVAQALPLFKGHAQPRIPADLGFYDLRLPETRELQAQLAQEAGIEGFCYWHYWFGNGKKLLERPFADVLKTGEPDFPFCLAWANHSWTNKSWQKAKAFNKESVIVEQQYPGEDDWIRHFNSVVNAFKDKRYIKVDNKPLFVIFSPFEIPDISAFINKWQSLAIENGLKGIHFVGIVQTASFRQIGRTGSGRFIIPDETTTSENFKHTLKLGFDAINSISLDRAMMLVKNKYHLIVKRGLSRYFKIEKLDIYNQSDINKNLLTKEDSWENVYPTIIPNWDRSPRAGKRAEIIVNSTPQVFKEIISECLEVVESKEDEHKIIFIRSWNEWGEGNYLEPDLQYGKGYLNVIKELMKS